MVLISIYVFIFISINIILIKAIWPIIGNMSLINNNIFPLHHILHHIQLNVRFSYLFTYPFSLCILWCFSSHLYLPRIEIFEFILVYFVSIVLYIMLESLKWIRSIKKKEDHCSYVRDLESDARMTVELNLVFISYRAVNVVHDRKILSVSVETMR